MGAFRGDRLQALRKQYQFSQDALADALNQRRIEEWHGDGEPSSITQQLVSWWETGRNEPSIENAVLIARVLQTTLDYLFGLVEGPSERFIPTVPDDPMWQKLALAARRGNVAEALEALAGITKNTNQPRVARK